MLVRLFPLSSPDHLLQVARIGGSQPVFGFTGDDLDRHDLIVRNDGASNFAYTLSVAAPTRTPLDDPSQIG